MKKQLFIGLILSNLIFIGLFLQTANPKIVKERLSYLEKNFNMHSIYIERIISEINDEIRPFISTNRIGEKFGIFYQNYGEQYEAIDIILDSLTNKNHTNKNTCQELSVVYDKLYDNYTQFIDSSYQKLHLKKSSLNNIKLEAKKTIEKRLINSIINRPNISSSHINSLSEKILFFAIQFDLLQHIKRVVSNKRNPFKTYPIAYTNASSFQKGDTIKLNIGLGHYIIGQDELDTIFNPFTYTLQIENDTFNYNYKPVDYYIIASNKLGFHEKELQFKATSSTGLSSISSYEFRYYVYE